MKIKEVQKMETIGRNDACWCGSGKKYKKCHCQFDEKLKELQQEGHIIPSHDMIKTPEQIEKIKESAQISTWNALKITIILSHRQSTPIRKRLTER